MSPDESQCLTILLNNNAPARCKALHIGYVLALFVTFSACVGPVKASPALFDSRGLPPELQALAERARGGDQQAQLELGIAYEEGRGVAADRKRAMKLYRMAAKDDPGTQWVYMPSPGGGAPAMVMPVKTGAPRAGLDEAKRRLQAMGDRR